MQAFVVRRFLLQCVQLLHDLRNGPVFLALAGVDVAAGGDVVVVLGNLLAVDDAAVFLLFLPRREGVGDARGWRRPGCSSSGRPWRTRWLALRRKSLPLRSFGLALFRNEDDAGGGGVVEEVFRQVDDALDEVLLHEPAADVLFLVGVGIAGAARGGAGVEHDGGAALSA